MRFWDSSAIVPLIVAEASTEELVASTVQDPVMCVWWATEVECTSALSKQEREGALTDVAITTALERLDRLAEAWNEVQPTAALRGIARRLLRVHPLRAVDSLQLAAAIIASERLPASLNIVTLDERLASAARREGFTVQAVDTAS
ncbi:MAG TPA: type II toxin-antitoxin system VapC family toxin [Solirubrobacteraceae bacterium]|nr:type II toxin-antitoxin system VapC family toxin [Solirubrobacteraceae bacterium]